MTKRILVAIIFAVTHALLAQVNLVPNPSFEQTDIKGGPRYYGSFFPVKPTPNPLHLEQADPTNITLDDTTVHTGSYALRIASAVPVRCSINQARFPVVSGQRLRLSGWMKAESLEPSGKLPGAVIRLAFGNTNDPAAQSTAYAQSLFLKADANDFDWTFYSGEVTVPESANQMILGCFLWESSGTVWFDDLSLEVVSGPETPADAVFDPNGLLRYYSANKELLSTAGHGQRVVFYGDSITDGWQLDAYFPGEGFINRGIGGQDTSQMLERLEQDVLSLNPQIVWLLGGTNDIARGYSDEAILANVRQIAEQCRLRGIKLIICSILPISDYHAQRDEHLRRSRLRPMARILSVNEGLREVAMNEGAQYLDLFNFLVDGDGMLPADLSNDGLHPNSKCYGIMKTHVFDSIKAAGKR